jgi:hypothetical protein
MELNTDDYPRRTMELEPTATQETEFVFRRLVESLRLFGREFEPSWFWVVLLVLILAAAFFYVGWMYKRDSRSVGGAWATFLGILRGLVYLLLAGVFLLPALQTWERTETQSKVVGLLDVSGSTGSRDDIPSDTISVEKLPTRQDKVIQFLIDDQAAFLKRLQEKNPVYLYRFGGRLDEDFQVFRGGKLWTAPEWTAWLKPDPKERMPDGLGDEDKAKFQKRLELHQLLVGGTNLGDSLLEVINRESNNMVQAIIVVSDGRSTQYSAQAYEELRARARKAKVPIMAVAVGEHRQPINILITDLQAPEQARPDDKFLVRVEVDGEGLPNKETTVHLDVTNPKGDKTVLDLPLRFNAGAGGPPHAQAEFEIDPAKLGATANSTKPELDEGEWVFRARVPKDRREIFLDPEHISSKATVNVVKKPLRVLLFANAPTHDFQFVRAHFVREVDQRRAELSVCLQIQRSGVVQDVPAERLLKYFPTLLQSEDAPQESPEDRYYNLAHYDLVVAFDPDWSKLQPEQLALLERWVNLNAGGLVLIAGPVNTYQLARPGSREQLKPILDLFPVILQDSRLQAIGIDRTTSEPWRLHFPGATAEMEFLKLDEESKDPLAGWEEFFTGRSREEAGKEAPLRRGFYSFYPVDGVKPSATVVATFSDPRANLRDGREHPYLVTMPYGSGKVVYIGSGETRRLRQYREVFHERFWTKLGRYAGSGNLTRLSRRGVLVMGREFTAGQFVRLEAQLFGRDLQPLSPGAVPKVQLKPPTGVAMQTTVDLQPKPSQGADWNGWFQGRFRVLAPGEYRLELHIPDTGDTLPGRFVVKESNPELDNTRPDFGQLYQLASDVTEVLPRMSEPAQVDLKRALEGTAARLLQQVDDKSAPDPRRGTGTEAVDKAREDAAKERTTLRLFFDLTSARLIPTCMVTDSKVQRSRGPVEDLWDRGFALWPGSAQQMAYVLLAVVLLLSLEWLTRKLLKLA